MFLSEPSSEMNLQTTSRGVCVCVRGGLGGEGEGQEQEEPREWMTTKGFL